MYQLIRIIGPWKRGVSKVTKESDGLLIHHQERRLELFGELFSWFNSTVNFALVPASEPIKVDTKPSSEMHVNKGIGFLERYEAAGSNGMPPFFQRCWQSVIMEVKKTPRINPANRGDP